MKFELECTYCGRKWNEDVWNASHISKNCKTCKDRYLIVRDYTDSKIDYYKGSPKFEEKEMKKIDSAMNGWMDKYGNR